MEVREFGSRVLYCALQIMYASRVLPDARYSNPLAFGILLALIVHSSENKAAGNFGLLGVLLKPS